MEITNLKWDSEFFNLKIGRIILLDTQDIDGAVTLTLEKARLNGYKLIYFITTESKFLNEDNLKTFNGSLMDRKVVYTGSIAKSPMTSTNAVYEYDHNHIHEDLKELALVSGEYSRYKLDENFKPDDFRRLYSLWIENSVRGIIADKVFVFKSNGAILGVVTVSAHKKCGEIGLLAVNPSMQGQGIGRSLLEHVENYLYNQSVLELNVSTQLSNIQACRFYEKMGLSVQSVNNIYHFWL